MIPKDQGGGGAANQKVNHPFPSRVVQNKSVTRIVGTRNRIRLFLLLVAASLALLIPASAQQLAKRLILKDGSYQLATKWEVKGDRVRYLSAERDEWEEVPNSLVDWAATDKFEKDRAAGVPTPEAVELDKEVEAERRAEEAKAPQVAPSLHLPDDGGMFLLDTFQTQPQLLLLQQNTGEVNRNTKANILRSAIKPLASGKQTIELDGLHASVQAHASLPAIYVNFDEEQSSSAQQGPQKPQQAEQPWDRYHIVQTQAKKGKRIIGDIKVNPLGKTIADIPPFSEGKLSVDVTLMTYQSSYTNYVGEYPWWGLLSLSVGSIVVRRRKKPDQTA